ncbi:MAG: hypothetical protein IT516_17750 [Burkholderiales bacterium]|nr:hypothetical protein [Burkholderiales bacterium]
MKRGTRSAVHGRIACAAVCVALTLPLTLPAAAVEFTPHGRVHLDYGAHDDDVAPMHDGFLLRRARLGFDAKFDADWSAEIAYDFVDAHDDGFHAGFKDVVLRYEGWKAADLSVGQFKLPFGLEALMSSNNSSFAEPALPTNAFAPSRRLGIGAHATRPRHTLAAMAFGPSIDGDDTGLGVAARLTATPIAADGHRLHLGIAAVAEWPHDPVKFSAWPESRVPDVKFVKTASLDHVRRIDRIGLEAAWQSGPVLVQAEWMRAALDRNQGDADAVLTGGYVAASWIVTGEARTYRNGVFKSVPIGRPEGTVELTARFSRVDLDDGSVRGGTEDNLTVGLVYYANRHLRLIANAIKVNSARRGKTDDPNLLVIRMQLAF